MYKVGKEERVAVSMWGFDVTRISNYFGGELVK